MNDTIIIKTPRCCVCGNHAFISVLENEYAAMVAGESVQSAFRSLDAVQRELIITGTHEHCWNAIFSDEPL